MPTFDQLKGLAFNQHQDELDAISAETLVAEKKLEIVQLKDNLSRTISLATRQAYDSGEITGKNAEQRQLQLDAILDADEAVQAARDKLAQAEKDLIQAETVAAFERAQARYSRSLFDAALACTKVSVQPTIMYIGDKPANGNGHNGNGKGHNHLVTDMADDAAKRRAAEAAAADEAWSQYLSDEAMAQAEAEQAASASAAEAEARAADAEAQGWQPEPEDDEEIPF